MIKKVSITILIVIAIPLLSAIFVKRNYSVKREVIIERNKKDVFNYIKYLKNQNNFSKWAQLDPQIKKTYSGIDGTVGFISYWRSKNKDIGEGEQEIINIIDGRRIDFELRFKQPFEATEPAYITTSSLSPHQTRVVWGFSGHMNYPMNLMFLFVNFEQKIGEDLQQGLDQLKIILEK